jgi:diketogulonate reductase-like aldo/keto reductase
MMEDKKMKEIEMKYGKNVEKVIMRYMIKSGVEKIKK